MSDYVAPTGGTSNSTGATLLSDVLDLFNQKVEEKSATYAVPKNERLTIKQRVTIGSEHFQRLVRQGVDDEGKPDNIVFSASLIAETNMGIFVDGKPVTDDGTPLRMLDQAFSKSVSSPSTVQSVRALFGGEGGDADLLQVGNDIVARSGFGSVYGGSRAEPVEFVDPTLPS